MDSAAAGATHPFAQTINMHGNVYIFNGFTTLHTNMNIDPRDVRATVLVHYHDIFKNSFLVSSNSLTFPSSKNPFLFKFFSEATFKIS